MDPSSGNEIASAAGYANLEIAAVLFVMASVSEFVMVPLACVLVSVVDLALEVVAAIDVSLEVRFVALVDYIRAAKLNFAFFVF